MDNPQGVHSPALIAQPNGKGALLAGGMPGNKGGTGRPANKVREAATLMFEKRLKRLGLIADGELKEERLTRDGIALVGPSLKVQLEAIVALGTIGMGNKVEVDPAPSAGWHLSFNVAPTHPAVQPASEPE